MAGKIAERIKVIDADTHVVEPADLWTSRVSKKWGDKVPHVVHYTGEDTTSNGGVTLTRPGDDMWVMGDQTGKDGDGQPVGVVAMAGWSEVMPGHPPTLADADPACYDAKARIERMDQYGLYAHVLYPNVGGFGAGRFLSLGEPELMLECVRAYNDFLIDFCSESPKRLVPLMATAFWDVEWTKKEIERCAKAGHRGILFTHLPESFGQPFLGDPHWNPLWETAQDLGLSINFHIGNGNMVGSRQFNPANGRQINYAKNTSTLFMDNALGVMEVIGSGLCHRYPNLNFVSVESGVGWIPFILESLGWQWDNSGVHEEHPEFNLSPREYFLRQIYGCFWFEKDSARAALDQLGDDNFLFETDFPHPTSVAPGPNSRSMNPIDHIEDRLGGLPERTLEKILHDNAAKIYHLD